MPVEAGRLLPDNPDAAFQLAAVRLLVQGERLSRPSRPSLVTRLERRTDELAVALLVRQAQAHPSLVGPDRERDAEGVGAARGLLRGFFGSYVEGRAPSSAELEAALDDGTRRAGEATPLGELLAAYHEGAEALWEHAVQEAKPDEQSELIGLAGHLLRWQGLLTRAAAESFVRELGQQDEEALAARRMLAADLLGSPRPESVEVGRAPAELLERAGVRLPQHPAVLAYRILEATAPPGAPGATARTVHELLDSLAGEPVLAEVRADGGVVLFPAQPGEVPLEPVLRALADALGGSLSAGVATAAGPEDIPLAAREAREVLDLAVALDLGPGLYRGDRLLLEHAVTARASSVQALAALLTPLERRPNLLVTLASWFAHDFDRGETAADLAIHRNTLDYRLRRVSDLTGLALDSARGLQTAGAALIARRVLASRASS